MKRGEKLREIVGDELRLLTSELFARKGYSVQPSPKLPDDKIDVIATSPNLSSRNLAYYIITPGRVSTNLLTETDIENSIPDIEPEEGTKLLLVTTRKESTTDARARMSASDHNIDLWYERELFSQLEIENSDYLIDVYVNGEYEIETPEDVKVRFEQFGLSVDTEIAEYISDETYHPYRLVGYVELKHKGKTTKLQNLSAVEKFRERTNIDDYV